MAISEKILEKTKLEGKRLVDNHPFQRKVYDDNTTQIKVLSCGRNGGKTILLILECLKYIYQNPETIAFFIFPTNEMAEKIVWDDLLKILNFQNWKIKVRNKPKSIDILFNKSKIYLGSADKADKLRGLRIDWLGVDEYALMKEATFWEEILEPCLTGRGKAVIASTPKGFGDAFHKLYMIGEERKDQRYRSWSWKSTDNPCDVVYNSRVENEKKLKDPKIFRQEHEASFEVSTGKCSPDFNNNNIHNLGIFEKNIRVSCDFNVNPMCWLILQIVPKELIQEKLQNSEIKLHDEIIYIVEEIKSL